MTLEEMRARLAAIGAEMRQIHEAAGDAGLSEEQQTRWDELVTERGRTPEGDAPGAGLLEEIRLREVRHDEIRRLGADPATAVSGDGVTGAPQVMRQVVAFDGSDVQRLSRGEARDKALKALESRELVDHLSDPALARLERDLRSRTRNTDGGQIARRLLVTENKDYRSAFMKMACQPNAVLTAEEGRAVNAFMEFREMNITTDGDGGFGVPVLIDPTIILDAQGTPNPFFAMSRVETITTDTWKGVSSAGVSWSFDAESAEVSDDSPTLAQPSVPVHKAQGLIPFTIEVGMDYPGFAAEMSMLLSEGYSELLVDKFTIGTGSGQPTGIITALDGSASEIDVATTNVLAAADVNGAWAALPARYRPNATWMTHTTVNNTIQALGSGGDSAEFTVTWTAEGVTVLKGRPFVTNDYIEDDFATSVVPFLVVGDFRNFLIAQRAGMSVELVPHLFHTTTNLPKGERAWYAWARVGSDSINDKGFRALSDNGA